MIFESLYKCQLWEISEENLKRLRKLKEDFDILELAYGQEIIPTDAYRTRQEHIEIYKKKNKGRKKADQIPVPINSRHLTANACDCADPTGDLRHFIEKNQKLMEMIGFYWEDFDYTEDQNYIHLQNVPYPSWKPGKPHYYRPY